MSGGLDAAPGLRRAGVGLPGQGALAAGVDLYAAVVTDRMAVLEAAGMVVTIAVDGVAARAPAQNLATGAHQVPHHNS